MMKVRVVRELVEGRYQVGFQVGEFTADEVKKMSQFGTPSIILTRTTNGVDQRIKALITQMPQTIAAFPSEEAAKAYENEMLQQLKTKIDSIRANEDKFTSIAEIDF